MLLVNAKFKQDQNVLIVLLEYTDLFQFGWQHETNIWEQTFGYSTLVLLYFILSIAIVTNYKHILFKFAHIMPAFCSLPFPSYYSNDFAGKTNTSLTISLYNYSWFICKWL